MYVLCTLVVLTIHSIFRNLQRALESNSTEAGDNTSPLRDRAPVVGHGARAKGPRPRAIRGPLGPNGRGRQSVDYRCKDGNDPQNVPDSRKTMQVNEWCRVKPDNLGISVTISKHIRG